MHFFSVFFKLKKTIDTVGDAIVNLGLIEFVIEMKRQPQLLHSSVSSQIK